MGIPTLGQIQGQAAGRRSRHPIRTCPRRSLTAVAWFQMMIGHVYIAYVSVFESLQCQIWSKIGTHSFVEWVAPLKTRRRMARERRRACYSCGFIKKM